MSDQAIPRDVFIPAADARPAVVSISNSLPRQPFQSPWSEAELALCLCVGSAAQLGGVVDGIGPGNLSRFFLTDARRFRRSDGRRKCRKPNRQLRRIIIDN